MTNAELDKMVRLAAKQLNLQAEDVFVLRVLQLHELLRVRHSVFLLGKAGTGKTQVWRTLLRAYTLMGLNPICSNLDPKVATGTFSLFLIYTYIKVYILEIFFKNF